MQQSGINLRGLTGGAAEAAVNEWVIDSTGSEVTLPDATVVNAIVSPNLHEIARLRPIDAAQMEKRPPLLFTFDPVQGLLIGEGMRLTWRGAVYIVDPPIHPIEQFNTLIQICAICYRL